MGTARGGLKAAACESCLRICCDHVQGEGEGCCDFKAGQVGVSLVPGRCTSCSRVGILLGWSCHVSRSVPVGPGDMLTSGAGSQGPWELGEARWLLRRQQGSASLREGTLLPPGPCRDTAQQDAPTQAPGLATASSPCLGCGGPGAGGAAEQAMRVCQHAWACPGRGLQSKDEVRFSSPAV